MFAIITPALISGAVAERMKFSTYCVFILLWATLVYDPICHWVWGDGGWLMEMGALDFAGGTVVHLSSGISALVLALFLGRRLGYPREPMMPHNLSMTLLGGGLLWFGWFGFNAGSALSAGSGAGLALATTQTAAAAAALSWILVEWVKAGKPSALGAASGVVAGLVVITPAAGFVTPFWALIMGLLAGVVCYGGVMMKYKLGYDDSLDAFGVHGIGGAFGALAPGFSPPSAPAASLPEICISSGSNWSESRPPVPTPSSSPSLFWRYSRRPWVCGSTKRKRSSAWIRVRMRSPDTIFPDPDSVFDRGLAMVI
jgi:Amt family ammonium transporter